MLSVIMLNVEKYRGTINSSWLKEFLKISYSSRANVLKLFMTFHNKLERWPVASLSSLV